MMIKPMRLTDVRAVLEIERVSFGTPWHATSFISELQQSHSRNYIVRIDSSERCPATDKTATIGFICYHLVSEELHLLKIAVKPECRRQGVALRVLRHCFEHEAKRGITAGILEVRQSNIAGIGLYHKMGFDVIGIRPHYYIQRDNQYEDAIIMKKHF